MPAADSAVVAVTRFIVPHEADDDFVARGRRLCDALARCAGHRHSRFAQALDDPSRWVMVSEFADVGSWRRALSAYDVRVEAIPLMALADAEPSVYEDRYQAPSEASSEASDE